MPVRLRAIAHSRTGDKGDISNIAVIVYDQNNYHRLERHVTAERVKAYFADLVRGDVVRYALPGLGALNFVLHGALGGGVTRSLALDAHGKCLSSAILDLESPEDDGATGDATFQAGNNASDALPPVPQSRIGEDQA